LIWKPGCVGLAGASTLPERLDLSILDDWPVNERQRLLDLGCIVHSPVTHLADLAAKAMGDKSTGWWECNLADDTLTWTSGVYRLFGFPAGVPIPRSEAVARYTEDSRAKMERLRSYAISNECGFALDAEILPADRSNPRWIRLIGTPLLVNGRMTCLQGLKFEI
jgi:hypothetical protein